MCFKVLDCYAEQYEKEISIKGNDWLRWHMNQNSDLIVVLVVTECAVAHQMAQYRSSTQSAIEYKKTDFRDQLFPMALKLLKVDLHIRVEVVELEGFKVDFESPTLFPNPFTRYKLPNALNQLICSILQ